MANVFSIENLKKWGYWGLLVLAISACVSEPLSRHAGKLAVIIFLVCLVKHSMLTNALKPYRKFFYAMAAFVLALILSAMSTDNFINAVWQYPVLFNYNMLLLPATLLFVRTEDKVLRLFTLLGCSLVILDMSLFYQVLHGNIRPHPLSSRGMVALGIFYGLLTPTFLSLYYRSSAIEKKKFLFFFIASLSGAFASGIRALWLSVAVSCCLVFLCEWRTKWKQSLAILSVIVIVVVGIAVTHDNYYGKIVSVTNMKQQQVTERFLMWQSAVNMFWDHPILGVGSGKYGDMYQQKYILPQAKEPHQRHAHSNYFQMLGEYGLLGFLTHICLMGYILCWAWRRRKNKYALCLLTSQVAFLLYSATESTFLEYGAMRSYWLVLALCVTGEGLPQNECHCQC